MAGGWRLTDRGDLRGPRGRLPGRSCADRARRGHRDGRVRVLLVVPNGGRRCRTGLAPGDPSQVVTDPIGGPALRRVLHHHHGQQSRRGVAGGQPRRVVVHDPVEAAQDVGPHVVGRSADDGVEQRRAEGPHVARRARRRPGRHLGCDVGGGARDEPRLRQRGVARRPGDAEVTELRVVGAAEDDVAGLDVAVDDPRGPGLDEGVGGLGEDRGRTSFRQRPLCSDQLGERPAVHVLHHQPEAVLVLDEVEDRHHVGVVGPGSEPRLALRAHDVVVGRAGQQADALHRDPAVQQLVVREVDHTGSTAADLLLQAIPACDHVDPFRG